MANKEISKEEIKEVDLQMEESVTETEACELVELAIDEFTLLTRAFEAISRACQNSEVDSDSDSDWRETVQDASISPYYLIH